MQGREDSDDNEGWRWRLGAWFLDDTHPAVLFSQPSCAPTPKTLLRNDHVDRTAYRAYRLAHPCRERVGRRDMDAKKKANSYPRRGQAVRIADSGRMGLQALDRVRSSPPATCVVTLLIITSMNMPPRFLVCDLSALVDHLSSELLRIRELVDLAIAGVDVSETSCTALAAL